MMWKDAVFVVAALAVSAGAGWLDLRRRKIPNWLTVPALLMGLMLAGVLEGWAGAKASLEGAGIGLGLLLPFVLARGLGAGDWKLMGALGALLGPQRTIVVLLGTVLITGLMAAAEVVRQRKVLETCRNVWILVIAYATFHVSDARSLSLDNPGLLKVPFGVAAAFSTWMFFAIVLALRYRSL